MGSPSIGNVEPFLPQNTLFCVNFTRNPDCISTPGFSISVVTRFATQPAGTKHDALARGRFSVLKAATLG
ncbi:hypothetical protein CEXT_90751 [Caerostris extrusa]|uniref:Uncharacterized protein n=1 Tax=Caerostris extrusa TaxID=172846 RepID=A0AAV4P7M3_CAEEX|nr:hypothetical protein CEXT_90751 [Caerostris extrusa]